MPRSSCLLEFVFTAELSDPTASYKTKGGLLVAMYEALTRYPQYDSFAIILPEDTSNYSVVLGNVVFRAQYETNALTHNSVEWWVNFVISTLSGKFSLFYKNNVEVRFIREMEKPVFQQGLEDFVTVIPPAFVKFKVGDKVRWRDEVRNDVELVEKSVYLEVVGVEDLPEDIILYDSESDIENVLRQLELKHPQVCLVQDVGQFALLRVNSIALVPFE
jgi:hypothetical protein